MEARWAVQTDLESVDPVDMLEISSVEKSAVSKKTCMMMPRSRVWWRSILG